MVRFSVMRLIKHLIKKKSLVSAPSNNQGYLKKNNVFRSLRPVAPPPPPAALLLL